MKKHLEVTMSNNKQTAVEWLIEQIDNKDMGEIPLWIYNFCEQAKEMEKQQIKDAYGVGHNEGCSYMTDGKTEFKDAEQYYNEKYGKDNADNTAV